MDAAVPRRIPATVTQSRMDGIKGFNYFSIGLCMYVAAVLIGHGLYQFVSGGRHAMASLGVNVVQVADQLQQQQQQEHHNSNDFGGSVLAALAVSVRGEHATGIAFGILLAYASYMLSFEAKGLVHLSVAIWAGLQAFAHHALLQQLHPWGFLSPAEEAQSLLSLFRIILALFSLLFWALAVVSFTVNWATKRNLAKKLV